MAIDDDANKATIPGRGRHRGARDTIVREHGDAANKAAIRAAGGRIEALVMIVRNGHAAGKVNAAGALRHLAIAIRAVGGIEALMTIVREHDDAANKAAIRAAGGRIEALVKIVRNRHAAGKANAAGALQHLAIAIRAVGGIEALVTIVREHGDAVNKAAIRAAGVWAEVETETGSVW